MKTREEIIEEMCKHYREDYLENKRPEDPAWIRGMTDKEREGLRRTMSELYDKVISRYDTSPPEH